MTEQELQEIRERTNYPKDFPRETVVRLLDEIDRLREALKGAAAISNHAGAEIKNLTMFGAKLVNENQRLRCALINARQFIFDHAWHSLDGNRLLKMIDEALGTNE